MKDIYQVIEGICLTEKATDLQERHNEYVFKVARKSNKLEIKEAVERIFQVSVVDVRTANCRGKEKNRRTKNHGRTPHWKKAVVRLKDSDHLDIV